MLCGSEWRCWDFVQDVAHIVVELVGGEGDINRGRGETKECECPLFNILNNILFT